MCRLFGEMDQRCEKRNAYRKAKKEWNNQFPPISCHPPFISTEEMNQLEQILRERKRNRKGLKIQTASE